MQKYNGRLLEITTEGGRQIKLTKNHPLLKNNLEWIPSYKLKKGDKIAISNIRVPSKKIKFCDWEQKLKKKWYFLTYTEYINLKKITNNFADFSKCSAKDFNDLRILINLRYKEIAKNTKFSYSWVTKILRQEKKLTTKLINRLNNYFKKIDKNKFKIEKNEIVVQTEKHPERVSCRFKDTKIDVDVVKWFSLLHAEGYARDKGLVVVQKNYPQILKEFIKISEEKFGIKFGKISKDKNNVTRFEVYSYPFIDYLKYKFNLKLGPSKESTICNWVLSLNKASQAVFLKYFFGTEGSVNERGNQIRLCQVNKTNLNILSVLLNNFSINHRFHNLIRKNKKNIEYYVTISGKDNFYKFTKEIGFFDKEKEIKVKKYLKKLGNKLFLTKFDNKYKNITFDKIRNIKKINYNDYLVDLVVPKYHNFFAGYGGILCHNTTLLYALTGRWTDTHSEEIKRGITIRLGYADAIIYKDKNIFTNKKTKTSKPVRKVSFVDAPGHESLMATMLAGSAIMDAAILLVAANETCPQPQTKEHLMALEIIGVKNIIIVQNKIDLVTEEQAKKNYEEIKNFIKGTIAENSQIIPISAQHNVNIDVLLEMIANIPTPKRDPLKPPLMFIARSFDINKPGQEVEALVGGVLGGSLKQGKLKVNDEIEIRPGIKEISHGKVKWVPLRTKIADLKTGGLSVKEVQPGGSIGLLTELDPSLVKSDSLSGNILGYPDNLPEVYYELNLKSHLLDRVIGTKEELKVEPIKKAESLLLNVNSTTTVGVVTELKKDHFHAILKLPICASKTDRITISRILGGRFRLIGYAEIV